VGGRPLPAGTEARALALAMSLSRASSRQGGGSLSGWPDGFMCIRRGLRDRLRYRGPIPAGRFAAQCKPGLRSDSAQPLPQATTQGNGRVQESKTFMTTRSSVCPRCRWWKSFVAQHRNKMGGAGEDGVRAGGHRRRNWAV